MDKSLYDIQRRKRFGKGRVFSKYCIHNVQIVKDFAPHLSCILCEGEINDAPAVHARTHFNRTLNREFSSYHEADKYAEKKGYQCIGNTPFNKVAKQLWPDHPMTQNLEGIY